MRKSYIATNESIIAQQASLLCPTVFLLRLQDREQSPRMPPLDTKFGIVAAMSKNGVIGVDGGIPWRVPQDRKLFKTLTDKGIMIFGKRTFEEHPTLAHINHTRGCIIVSRSMKTIQSNHSGHHAPNTILKLARSLPEGLVLAGKLKELFLPVDDTTTSTTLTSKNKESDITCWIAGGQRLYEEALTRDCVAELHLSVVDIDIDYSTRSQHDDQERRVAMFPPRNLWTDRFEETSKTFYSQDGDAPSFNYYVYHRRND
jgi:dihydrofolate reductase